MQWRQLHTHAAQSPRGKTLKPLMCCDLGGIKGGTDSHDGIHPDIPSRYATGKQEVFYD